MSSLHWGVEEDEKTTHFTITSQAIDSSIALYFELLSNEITTPTATTTTSSTNTYVYVQFIVHNCWKEEVQDYVTRVITHRLTLAKDVQSHLKSMNPQTTAVAIVKRAVLLGSPSTTDTNDLEDTYVTFATTHRGNGAVDDGDNDNGILRNDTIDADDTDDIDIEEEEEEEEEKRDRGDEDDEDGGDGEGGGGEARKQGEEKEYHRARCDGIMAAWGDNFKDDTRSTHGSVCPEVDGKGKGVGMGWGWGWETFTLSMLLSKHTHIIHGCCGS